jgi:hypothetical protein
LRLQRNQETILYDLIWIESTARSWPFCRLVDASNLELAEAVSLSRRNATSVTGDSRAGLHQALRGAAECRAPVWE